MKEEKKEGVSKEEIKVLINVPQMPKILQALLKFREASKSDNQERRE